MRILYCGFGRAGLECLYQLMSGFCINTSDILVFTHNAKENEEFVKHLEYNNIKYHIESVNNFIDDIDQFNPHYLLSVYYRKIIKPDILNIVDFKAMNLHPSLLPAYRGTKSSVWALLNKEKETGITYHYMNENIDDGNIILQQQIDIDYEDTAFSLYHKLISLFVKNFNTAFELLIAGYEGEVQKGEVSYYPRKLPFNGERRFDEISFDEAVQFVKAMYFPPYKGALFRKRNGETVEILNIQKLNEYKDLIGKS